MTTHNFPQPACIQATLKEFGRLAFTETVVEAEEPYPEQSQMYLTLIHLLDIGRVSSTEYVKIDSCIKAGFLEARFLHETRCEKEKENIENHNINKNQ